MSYNTKYCRLLQPYAERLNRIQFHFLDRLRKSVECTWKSLQKLLEIRRGELRKHDMGTPEGRGMEADREGM